VVITNGTHTHRTTVKEGFRRLAAHRGQIWFKLDAGTDADLSRIHQTPIKLQAQLDRLALAAEACPTWIQTAWVGWDGEPPSEAMTAAYVDALQHALDRGIALEGVLLYGLARPSHQSVAGRLHRLPEATLNALAQRIEALGLPCKVSP